MIKRIVTLLCATMLGTMLVGCDAETSDDGHKDTNIEQNEGKKDAEESDTEKTDTHESSAEIFRYTIEGDEVCITGLRDSSQTEICIPKKIEGCLVTGIGERAFGGCSGLTGIEIPDSVTSIAWDAFDGTAWLDQQKENEDFLVLGAGLLYWVSEDVSGEVVIPDGVTSIEISVFANRSSLTAVKIPDSVTSIGHGAFGNCSSLTDVEIPDSVTSIGYGAFSNCSSLTNMEIPDGVTSIGYDAFSSTPWYDKQKEGTDYLVLGDGILCWVSPEAQKAPVIPSTVKVINTEVFEYGDMASIEIPSSVIRIEESAFAYCDLRSIEIPDSVTNIERYAFFSCDYLKSVKLSSSMTNIADSTFADCWQLESVEIPDGITSIGDCAFAGCKRLKSVEIPDSVTSIGYNAFFECNSLADVKIPDGITSITYGAFDDTLWKENCGDFLVLGAGILYWVSEDVSGEFVIPDGVTCIGISAFRNCGSITAVKIPDSVTSIGGRSFEFCRELESIEIPDSVTSIGDAAFYDCSKLTTVKIPDSVTSIGGNNVFAGCDSLTSIIVSKDSYAEQWVIEEVNKYSDILVVE